MEDNLFTSIDFCKYFCEFFSCDMKHSRSKRNIKARSCADLINSNTYSSASKKSIKIFLLVYPLSVFLIYAIHVLAHKISSFLYFIFNNL
ncbi:unnamed protein product [Blepharisma stoltei]|uniref:Uncharacterized protein n=1 Tax=Blepharisma stoltei TaxID=1481888 RepID=A0AAU9IRI8_9CILI|nr:unnamed protein product [Blepharisma stoltei]